MGKTAQFTVKSQTANSRTDYTITVRFFVMRECTTLSQFNIGRTSIYEKSLRRNICPKINFNNTSGQNYLQIPTGGA